MSGKRYFDEVARQWDEMREEFFSDTVRERALAVACVEPGKLAADIGAGTGFITDLDEHQYEFLRTEQQDRWLGFKREDIEKWFKDAGLEDVTIDCVDDDCCAQSKCGCDSANISIFLASGVK